MTKQNTVNQKPARKAVSAILFTFAMVFALTACSAGSETPSENPAGAAGQQSTQQASDQASVQDSDLVIPTSEVTEQATFYPVEVDGTKMEVIAVKAPDGTIRTAFNTCQVCYDSGRGYYQQSGDLLICQNCGNKFSMDRVEVEAGGCNPWPIFAEDKTATDESITVSYDFLQKSKDIFANWKRTY